MVIFNQSFLINNFPVKTNLLEFVFKWIKKQVFRLTFGSFWNKFLEGISCKMFNLNYRPIIRQSLFKFAIAVIILTICTSLFSALWFICVLFCVAPFNENFTRMEQVYFDFMENFIAFHFNCSWVKASKSTSWLWSSNLKLNVEALLPGARLLRKIVGNNREQVR